MYFNRQLPFQQQLVEALELIKGSIDLEEMARENYDWLLDNIPTEGITIQQRKEISDRLIYIRDKKIQHPEVLAKIYFDFTGTKLETAPRHFIPPESFIEGIKTALYEQVNLVERYREIMFRFPGNYYRDMLFKIITDEFIISDLLNFIYATVFHTTQEVNEAKNSNNNLVE